MGGLGTEYSPSELSDIVRQEGVSDSESDVSDDVRVLRF